ncbi:MAG: release factor glutamine methyltransferase [Francisellaceae bacterium]|jgi:release factor glutamine methyltransferase
MKIRNVITLNDQLLHKVSDTPRLDTELLLSHVLNKSKSYLYTWPETEVNQNEYINLTELVLQRQKGVPIAHLTGKKWFWDTELTVTKDTLIPRPDTECIIEAILDIYPNPGSQQLNILDLGTGSGAIAICLAKIFKSSRVTATDICKNALDIAEDNASKNNLKNISFVNSNWFESLSLKNNYDIIVSNPPYISIDDKDIESEVKKYEPKIALFSNNNGYDDIFQIIYNAILYLSNGGNLFIEHGHKQGQTVSAKLHDNKYIDINKILDIAQKWRGTSAAKI